jgi:hypothetical protein
MEPNRNIFNLLINSMNLLQLRIELQCNNLVISVLVILDFLSGKNITDTLEAIVNTRVQSTLVK